MAEEFYPVDVNNLIEQVWTSMWQATIQNLDIELWPYIEKLNVLEPGQYEDPSVKQLFKWLLDENRTLEELNYIFGPLLQSMSRFNKRATYVEYDIKINDVCPLFLGLLSAEVLAVKNPILLGLWENVAWFFVRFAADFHNKIDEELVSDKLDDWIIRMMADSDLCPNPYLRLEFMNIFGNISLLNTSNEMQAFQSVMITCSTLNRDPIREFLRSGDNGNKMLWTILSVFGKISDYEILGDFDKQLSDKLMSVFSAGVPSVQCLYELNSNTSKWSYEVNFISVLFQTISGYAHQMYQYFHQNLDVLPSDLDPIPDDFFVISHNAKTIMSYFRNSCKTPQLVDATASCVMDVLELALMLNITLLTNRNIVYREFLTLACELLEEIDYIYDDDFIDNTLFSPVGQTLIHKYHIRLTNLRQQLGQLSLVRQTFLRLDHYHIICSILYHCNYNT